MQLDFFLPFQAKKNISLVYILEWVHVHYNLHPPLMIILICSFCRKKKKKTLFHWPGSSQNDDSVNEILLSYWKPNDNTQFFTERNSNSFYLFALHREAPYISFKAGFLKCGPLWRVVLCVGRCLVTFLTSTHYTTSVTHTHAYTNSLSCGKQKCLQSFIAKCPVEGNISPGWEPWL